MYILNVLGVLLKIVNVSKNIASIYSYAFEKCGLKNLFIPTSVTVIGTRAFYRCDDLIIYCEIDSQPEGWNLNWNYYRPVYWAGKWKYDANGNSVPLS